jgi:hypothetical protein
METKSEFDYHCDRIVGMSVVGLVKLLIEVEPWRMGIVERCDAPIRGRKFQECK